MFNDDQRAYMDQLGRIPAAEKCWCGWTRLGGICAQNCNTKHPGKTRADYLAIACQDCRSLPGHRHRIGCTYDTEAAQDCAKVR